MEQRLYQQTAIADALSFLSTAAPGARRLYAAPTGTGKSFIELEILRQLPGALLVTPRVEIIAGMLDKLGVDTEGMTVPTLVDTALRLRITTPIRLRNALARCELSQPKQLILDESHHHSATTYQEIDLLASNAPTVGFTATPYRGSPRQTVAFREVWGEPVWILSYPEAAAMGVISIPTCKVVPLVDDDAISIVSGEFVVEAASKATSSRVAAVAELCRTLPSRPTMIGVPSVETAATMLAALTAASVPAALVTGSTSPADRQAAFAACVAAEAILVQINVVSEGVDLPIRRLIDLRPTLSPVYWLQQVGRITRKTDGEPPEYICCCRNLERHSYLLQGCVPLSTVRDAQQAFETPSKRAGVRAVGLEAVGRFKATELPLLGGVTGTMYCFQCVEGQNVRQYAVLVHPAAQDALCATRVNVGDPYGSKTYGRWKQCEVPEVTDGFASVSAGPVTDPMAAWWKKSAERHGLDPAGCKNRRVFAALPVLANLGMKLEV